MKYLIAIAIPIIPKMWYLSDTSNYRLQEELCSSILVVGRMVGYFIDFFNPHISQLAVLVPISVTYCGSAIIVAHDSKNLTFISGVTSLLCKRGLNHS